MHLISVFLLILAVRLLSVFVVQTYYVPDEYWQSLEVAHKLVFGYGYLTWEWTAGIRCYGYPLVFAAVYKVLALLKQDTTFLLITVPRILQALLSAYSDYRFFVWTGRKKWALFLMLVSWFWFYIGSRTLVNTLETSLTTIALSYFPWHGETTNYLWLVAICCYLRPTAALVWVPLCIYHIRKTRMPVQQLIAKNFILIGMVVVASGVAVDSYFFGNVIVTPFEFLKYNIFNNIGSFYGSHPWYWYFTVGLPTVLGITFLPFLISVVDTIRYHRAYPVRKQLLITITASLFVLSFVEHKEFRFVAPLLPLCLYISADYLTRWSYNASRPMLWLVAIIIAGANISPAWYLSTVHQRGPLDLMPKLQEIARNYRDESSHRASILFLMPCHSTPYYSHVHENVTMRFLTCEPNVLEKADYKDEADRFYEDPPRWLRQHIPSYPRTALPSHVVLYAPLQRKINDFLLNYKLVHRIGHGEVIEELVKPLLSREWPALLKDKQPDVETLLQYVGARTGSHIHVYQRLRAGEENSYNRDEFDASPRGSPTLAGEIDENADTDDGYARERNLFN